MSVRGRQQPAHVKARIARGLARYHQRRREALRVLPADLVRYAAEGEVAHALVPIVAEAMSESQALAAALGGPDTISPQRAMIVADIARVGVALRGELARYLRTQDPDAGSRIGTLAGVRRAGLQALGLERQEKSLDLRDYLKARSAQPAEDRVGEEIAAAPGAQPQPVEVRPATADGDVDV